jgi:phosphoribosylaminoimidazole-succinocarboxamide synthase
MPHEWQKRAMLVHKGRVLPIECVVRGYLAGSGWKQYQQSRSVCGVELDAGLVESDKLPQPIFTPTTKSKTGHDEPMTLQDVADTNDIGWVTALDLERISLNLYTLAADYALKRGIIIADTKFEYAWIGDELVLVDEIFTPDSSRFWDVEQYEPGRPQDSFDKQYVRNYLESIGWDKNPPAPPLPEEIIDGTRRRYIQAYEILTGQTW